MSMTVDGRSRDTQLQAMHRIASMSMYEEGLEGAIREILRCIHDVVPCERALLFLYDEDTDDMRAFGGQGEEEDRLSLSGPGIVRRIFNSARGEVVDDVLGDPDGSPALGELYDSRNLVGAPLVSGETRMGVAVAVNSKRSGFTDEDLTVLSVLADKAAAMVRGAHMCRDLDRQARELDGLQRLSRLLTSDESLEHVIGEAVRVVTDLLECERMMVLLHDEDSDLLRVQKPALGIDEGKVGNLQIPLDEPSLASTVFRTCTPLVSNDAKHDAWVGPRLRSLLRIDNLLVVPLTSGHQPLGVLEAINSQKGYFDDEDLRFTSLLGARMAAVIDLNRTRARERALMQRLRETDRAKSDFVSMLAHELKGPMTTIVGFGQTLEEHWANLEDEKRTQFLGIVRRETERLAHLVSDLLDISRMESGNLRYEFEPMSLRELIESIVTIHASIAATHELEVELDPDMPNVLGDHERIRQVVINLLTNAVRYSPEGTTITLRGGRDPEDPSMVRVSVTDEGIGIAPGDTERIFSKFAMLAKPAWTKKGTGLGLFISKTIIDAHNGNLWVESQPSQGSTFHFTVPVTDGDG